MEHVYAIRIAVAGVPLALAGRDNHMVSLFHNNKRRMRRRGAERPNFRLSQPHGANNLRNEGEQSRNQVVFP